MSKISVTFRVIESDGIHTLFFQCSQYSKNSEMRLKLLIHCIVGGFLLMWLELNLFRDL